MSSRPDYQQALESLPTLVWIPQHVFFADVDIPAFLKHDLDLSRLDRIHDHLWIAGLQRRAHPLHRYQLIGSEIKGTQQMDLHLVGLRGSPQMIMVKPLPYWIFSHEFWSKHICHDILLWESAAGLLLSYAWLITTPLDLQIAQDLSFLPRSITWGRWKLLIRSFGDHVDIKTRDQVRLSCSALTVTYKRRQ